MGVVEPVFFHFSFIQRSSPLNIEHMFYIKYNKNWDFVKSYLPKSKWTLFSSSETERFWISQRFLMIVKLLSISQKRIFGASLCSEASPTIILGQTSLSFRSSEKLNKIAILFKKSVVRKASRRKKRPCKEYPCKVFLLFALPRVLLTGFALNKCLILLFSLSEQSAVAARRAIGTRKGEQET